MRATKEKTCGKGKGKDIDIALSFVVKYCLITNSNTQKKDLVKQYRHLVKQYRQVENLPDLNTEDSSPADITGGISIESSDDSPPLSTEFAMMEETPEDPALEIGWTRPLSPRLKQGPAKEKGKTLKKTKGQSSCI